MQPPHHHAKGMVIITIPFKALERGLPSATLLKIEEPFYQLVTAVIALASSTGKYFSRSPGTSPRGDDMTTTPEL